MPRFAPGRRMAAITGLIALLLVLGNTLVACQPAPSTEPTRPTPTANPTATSIPAAVKPYPAEISTAEGLARRDQGAFILDVRQPDEWADYHVPGSTLIPLDQLPARLNEVPQDREIVVVCRSGNRSQAGRDILLKAGYPSVTSLKGGLSQWKAAGYPTVSGQ